MMNRKYLFILLVFISCSTHAIAQKDYYYCANLKASELELRAGILTNPNDSLFYQQWGLHNSLYPDVDISANSAWNYSTGKNIKIAIIDTGVDMNHIDLSSNIDSISYDTETGQSSHIDYFQGNYAHGTHCAGIAAAVKDNGIYIAGVAPEAKIVSISNSLFLSESNSEKLANGIRWACDHDVDVISCSWGASYNSNMNDAIQYALTNGRHGKGCVIVFATGNDGLNCVSYPANCNDMILAVGAIDNTGNIYPFSNYGAELDLVAPGVNILSTTPYNRIGYKSGTSMACPHVAGVAALILQRNSELTVNQVDSIICKSTKKIPNQNYYTETKSYGSWNNQYGYGLVDAYYAVMNTPDTVFIQNDTISGTRVFSGEKIYIGKDVTNNKPYGNVVLGQGNITLQGNYIKIKNSTTVPLGTTLVIE